MTYLIRKRTTAALAALTLVVAASAMPAAWAQDVQRIRIRMGDGAVTATLNDSAAARDFFTMLPVSIRMDDLLRREKTGVLSRRLLGETQGSSSYALADLGYWRPRGSFVIFYRHDGLNIPPPGIVLLGKVDAGIELFEPPGSVDVTIERLD